MKNLYCLIFVMAALTLHGQNHFDNRPYRLPLALKLSDLSLHGIDVDSLRRTPSISIGGGAECSQRDPFELYYENGNVYFYFSKGSMFNRLKFDFNTLRTSANLFDQSPAPKKRGRNLKLYTIEQKEISHRVYYPLKQICLNPLMYITIYSSKDAKTAGGNEFRVYELYLVNNLDDMVKILDQPTEEKVLSLFYSKLHINEFEPFANSDRLREYISIKKQLEQDELKKKKLAELKPAALSFYKSEIANEIKQSNLFAPKDEFETLSEFNLRKQKAEKYKAEIELKYNQLYYDHMLDVQAKLQEKIKNSYVRIPERITKVGTYDADKQVFTIEFEKLQARNISIPRDEAKSFKDNYQRAIVTVDKQLNEGGDEYRFFNIEIVHPVTGSKYVADAALPLYLDFIPKQTSESGVPLLEAKVIFVEPSGNNLLDGNEMAKFVVSLTNKGTATARNIQVNLHGTPVTGITFDKVKSITGLNANESQELVFNIQADRSTRSGEMTINFIFSEGKGFKPADINYKINIQEFKKPKLHFVEAGIKEVTGNGNNIIENGENIEVTLLVQNVGQGNAESVNATVTIEDPNIVSLTPTKMVQSIGQLKPGETATLGFRFSVNYEYKGSDKLPIHITLTEKFQEYGGLFPLNLEMKKLSLAAIDLQTMGEYSNIKEIKNVTLTSDVDRDIPVVTKQYPNRYALIIGNEDYATYQKGLRKESNVDFATADARSFEQYARKTLGIEQTNMTTLINAQNWQIEQELNRLKEIIRLREGQAEVFFYFSGHGVPDDNGNAYLLPVNVSAQEVTEAGLGIDRLYRTLTEHNPRRITVFLDACFSGAGRNQGLLAAKAAVRIKPTNQQLLQGNIVVFSSSTGEQKSQFDNDKKHGVFTYYLLKKLKETKGTVNYQELSDFLSREVPLFLHEKRKEPQHPQVLFSPAVEQQWSGWKFAE